MSFGMLGEGDLCLGGILASSFFRGLERSTSIAPHSHLVVIVNELFVHFLTFTLGGSAMTTHIGPHANLVVVVNHLFGQFLTSDTLGGIDVTAHVAPHANFVVIINHLVTNFSPVNWLSTLIF